MPLERDSDAGLDEAIDRFWDQIAQHRASDAGDLDPAAAATLRRLHAADDGPGPDRAFAKRLREELMHAHMHAHASEPFAGLSLPLAPSHGVRPLPGRIDRRSFVAYLATAALLLLTVGGSFFAFGIGRFGRLNDAPAYLPALSGTPATPETVVTETLFDAPVDNLPTGTGEAAFIRWTLKPSATDLVALPQEGPRFFVVESGEVTVTEAGTEQRLTGGDTYVVADPNQEVSIHVNGPEEAVVFRGSVAEAWVSASWDAVNHTYEWLIESASGDLPGGAGRLVVERLTLPLGSALPPQEANRLEWTVAASGTLGLTLEGPELPAGWITGEEKPIGLDSLWPEAPAGTRMLLRNAGDEPLVLYRMTLTPDAETAIGGTPSAEPVVTETLVDAAVDGLPTGWGTVVLYSWELAPNSQPLVFPPAEGARFYLVESGAPTVTEAGVERRLAAGDVYVPTDPDAEVAFLGGAEGATLLDGVVAKTKPFVEQDQFNHRQEFLLEHVAFTLPGGSGRINLERLTLPPGSALPAREIGSLEWGDSFGGTTALTLEGSALPAGWTAGEEQTVGFLSEVAIAPGTRMTLRNAGDEPLVLYRMTLTPDAAEAQTAGTPAP